MGKPRSLDTILLIATIALFCWFFSSSLSIAWHRAPSQDDAMFATVTKNFLQGEGWATNYGEKIPLNPDLTAGPVLLLSAAPLMFLFGNSIWVPAITGAVTNIFLTLLILSQLYYRHGLRPVIFLSLLLALSLYIPGDFKTFTGYYTSSLLFLFSCLFVLNARLPILLRMTGFGAMAAVGLYIKPLILLSYMSAAAILAIWAMKNKSLGKRSAGFVLIGFLVTVLPWQFYKAYSLRQESPAFQQSHQEYARFFFEHHGSGIAQYQNAPDKINYLGKNTHKNFRILDRHLRNHLGIPLALVLPAVLIAALVLSYRFLFCREAAPSPELLLVAAASINLVWFLVFAFALTPGHAFFAVFFCVFTAFYLLCSRIASWLLALGLSLALIIIMSPTHPSVAAAYSFRQDDPLISQDALLKTARALDSSSYSLPLASCGYSGAPWRLIYLSDSNSMIKDCYHLLEDALRTQADGTYRWDEIPDFILVVEGAGLMAALKSQGYVLGPLLNLCSKRVILRENAIGLCEIKGGELLHQLDPEKTARELPRYQSWYRTRLRS